MLDIIILLDICSFTPTMLGDLDVKVMDLENRFFFFFGLDVWLKVFKDHGISLYPMAGIF